MMKPITDNNAFLMAMGSDSRIEIHAADAAKDSWTQIAKTAVAGDTTLTLAEATGWQVGDKIAIASSSFDMDEAEELTITHVSDDGLTITFDTELQHTHFGEIETHTNGKEGDELKTWDLDMRAEVALLSRNVTIQGDADSSEDGYGGHTMIMNGAEMHIDGAELTKMGQIGEVGRYPVHWHMLGDASGQYLTNASIHETFNKGLTIHGTENLWIEDVAIYDTIGHTYYFEDGSESGNVLKDTLGMNTRASASLEDAPIGSDVTAVSTYWLTNPDNHLIGNHAAGSENAGFWILAQEHVEGTSSNYDLYPEYEDYSPKAQNPGQWVGNLSHTNAKDGLFIGRQFDETDGSSAQDLPLEKEYQLTDFTTYKNGEFAIWQRNAKGEITDLKVADSNVGIQIWGNSTLSDSLFVGRTGNSDDTLDQHVGVQLYDDATHYTGLHFDGFDGALDAAISNGWGFGRSTIYTVEDLTFGDRVPDGKTFVNTLTVNANHVSDQGGPTSGAIIDLDGSLTGVVGGIITPGLIDFVPDAHVDVLTYADDTIEASGFNSTEGAEWLAENRAWVHTADKVIGKMVIIQKTRDADGELVDVKNEFAGDRITYTVERSDNGAKIEINEDAMVSYAWHVQLNVDTSEGVEYIFDYSAETPDALVFDLSDLPEGATAMYRIKGLPDGVVFQQADAAESVEAFDAATVTTWIQDENGDYLVKAVADSFLPWRLPRSDTEEAATRIYNDEFKLFITQPEAVEPSGNGTPFFNVEDHPWKLAVPNELPTRAESTSKTEVIEETHARWSDAASWSGDLPGLEDIVIIGPGQTMILDTFVRVKAIFVNGGELIVEDTKDLKLAADWILVNGGGLFQVGTEDSPFVHDFELTLEGDDPDNDIDLMALMASTDADVIRAVANEGLQDPETTQNTVVDTDDSRPWDYFTDTFDADGARLSRTLLLDDGRHSVTTLADGVRAEIFETDAGNVYDWHTRQKTYTEDGVLQQSTDIFDDGRVNVTDFVDGVRTTKTDTDVDDAKPWSEIVTTYAESGAATSRIISLDDGRVNTTTHVNGRRAEAVTVDGNDRYDWDTRLTTFDEDAVLLRDVKTFDDGRTFVTDFVDGVRALKVDTDVEDAANWSSIVTTYTETGEQASRVRTQDDGRIIESTFTDGLLSKVTTTDGADDFAWNTREISFAANGTRLETTMTFDNGGVVTTDHVNLLMAVNAGGNADFTATNGMVYAADTFNNGQQFGTGSDISGTENDGIYKSERWDFGGFTYDIAVENGTYLVELNFAEIYGPAGEAGQRVFDVFAEDVLIFDDLDIGGEVGLNAALDLVGQVEVTDGFLTLTTESNVSGPKISGFSIWETDDTGNTDFVYGSIAEDYVFI